METSRKSYTVRATLLSKSLNRDGMAGLYDFRAFRFVWVLSWNKKVDYVNLYPDDLITIDELIEFRLLIDKKIEDKKVN